MAGAALAINLAYLNLERFRYRKKIREHAREVKERLSTDVNGESPHEGSELYQRVVRLSALPDEINYKKKSTKGNLEVNESWDMGEVPGDIWWRIYRFLFERHQDRVIVFCTTGVSLVMFFLGTAHSVDHLSSIACWFESGAIWLYVVTAALVAPIILVFLGSQIVGWGTKHASWCIAKIEEIMAKQVDEAELKPKNS